MLNKADMSNLNDYRGGYGSSVDAEMVRSMSREILRLYSLIGEMAFRAKDPKDGFQALREALKNAPAGKDPVEVLEEWAAK